MALELKRNLRKIYGCNVHFAGRGEMIPNEESYCEIDPDTVDQWGIPVLRFHFKWSEDEILQAKHMQETFQEIIAAAGGKVISPLGPRNFVGHFARAAKSSTRWAPRAWAATQDLGAELVLPGMGLQEPVRHRRRAVRQQRRQESHPDHYRAGLADREYIVDQMKKKEL